MLFLKIGEKPMPKKRQVIFTFGEIMSETINKRQLFKYDDNTLLAVANVKGNEMFKESFLTHWHEEIEFEYNISGEAFGLFVFT